jgi:hypothetical protein
MRPAFHPVQTALLGLMASLGLASCSLFAPRPAVIWTDAPEFALYAELFNAGQDRYRVEVSYHANLVSALGRSSKDPDLVIGSYLKSQASRGRFQSLDYLFGELTVNQAAFYPSLLAQGDSGGRQILLPVSFDLPAIVFTQGGKANAARKFLLGLDDLAAEAKAWNQGGGGASFSRMGFSPRWNADFLVISAEALGAAFREGKPLGWSEAGLDGAVDKLRAWTVSANASPILEDDFQFKYLYTPAYKYVAEGRALFSYMRASALFLVPEEKRAGLDYRWYAEGGLVPIAEDAVYAGIPRKARGKSAAEAFLKWFYKEESQKAMLESSRKTRNLEGSFGIAGGFSAVRTVTERTFPLYYRGLVGHLPPAENLSQPAALPGDWPEIDSKVVAPWLLETTARRAGTAGRPGDELASRLAAWTKNRGR